MYAGFYVRTLIYSESKKSSLGCLKHTITIPRTHVTISAKCTVLNKHGKEMYKNKPEHDIQMNT